MRPTLQHIYMNMAYSLKTRVTCLRGGTGVVITRGNRIISTGYTGSPPGDDHCLDVGCLMMGDDLGCIRTLHGETNAIAQAAKYGIYLNGAELYTTMSPCLSCAKLIYSVGIVTVYYSELYRITTGLGFLKAHDILCVQIDNIHNHVQP